MALNFPDNPPDGDVYVAENGVEYTYNASIDAWTGNSAAGNNLWAESADTTAIYPVTTTDDVWVGGSTAATAKIILDAGDGSATFAKSVVSGGNPSGGGAVA